MTKPPGINWCNPTRWHTWKEQMHEKVPLVSEKLTLTFCKSHSSAWTTTPFWIEIIEYAVTPNAERSSPTCTLTHTHTRTHTHSNTFDDIGEDDHLHPLWLKRLITSLVCVLYARLKMTCHWLAATSFSRPKAKPCALLAASGCMSNCPGCWTRGECF